MSDLHLDLLSADSLFNDGTGTIEGLRDNDTAYAVVGQSDVIVRAACRGSVEFDAGLDSVKRCEIKEPL